VQSKTRYSARAVTEVKANKVAAKTLKSEQKAAATPSPLTAEEKTEQQLQSAPIGLNGDTGSKKKKTKVKGAPKERLAEQPPAPPAPKPEATPIPPKSVRDNGEPVVSPPPPTAPATGAQPGVNPAPTATNPQ
jgi:peptidyl-prolyl cis-trans isomerase SurA